MSTKIDATERLLNLVIALLGTRRGYSKSHIRNHINGYASDAGADDEKAQVSFERMFERDKKILLELGIPLKQSEVAGNDAQEQVLYRIRPEDYRVPEIRLDESAMTLLAIAANLWAGASLGAPAQSALRKIAARTGTGWYEDDTTSQSRIRTAEPAFEALWDALRNHHPVTFDYRKSATAQATPRTVQPWGLGSKYGQWYLAAYDLEKNAERNFRLSRITSEVLVHGKERFEPPANFQIGTVLSRLGTGTELSAHIGVPEGSAHWLRTEAMGQAAALQTSQTQAPEAQAADDGLDDLLWSREGWEVLTTTYRSPELMADDVAAMGAQAFVVAPAELKDAVAGRLHRAAAAAEQEPQTLNWSKPMAPANSRKPDSRERLVRLLSMVPYLVTNPGVEESEVMAEFGISAKQWEKDRDTLSLTGLPGYFPGDLMDVSTESGQVFIRDAETLASPLRLTQEEACSVLIGLQALSTIPAPGRARALEQAIASLTAVAGKDAWLADAVGLHLVSGKEMDNVAALQNIIQQGRACSITYLVRHRDEVSERIVEPLRLFSLDATWYLRAWCRKVEGLRSFRVDRIQEMSDAGTQAHVPATSVDWQPGGSIYSPGSGDQQVQLIADSTTARRLAPAYNAQLFDLGGGMVGLQLLVGDTSTLAPLMARLGGHARVAGPEPVRQQVAAWLSESATSYDADGETVRAIPSVGR
ncbi:WYL domain-containing protein [Specibacter sp. NPDC078692]|uniref:helix-turn-helix transcriptional regulator n=1 Tax=Specibacter sp. NPDC078692 TaxID=3155818 RepID=UPI0034217FF7